MPFLRRVTRGRDVPEERLAIVAQQYHAVGGASPINSQNRTLVQALRVELDDHGLHLPLYWGNRNAAPFVTDVVRQMTSDGIQRALVFVTSAYSSFSGCRQYLDDLAGACRDVGDEAPRLEKLRQFFNHPGFIESMVVNTRAALEELDRAARDEARLVFTAHSIPLAMARSCRYESQLHEAARLVAERISPDRQWDLVFQSRSGRANVPWLAPDIVEHLETLRTQGVGSVVVVPIGFVSDHMEVVHDLDFVAIPRARDFGLQVTRASTVGISPGFVSMIRELIEERVWAAPVTWVGEIGATTCMGDTCCLP